MSIFTSEEGERELYDEMEDPLVQFVMKLYWDDKIEYWKDCKLVLDYILNNGLPQETRVNYLVDWFNYKPK